MPQSTKNGAMDK